MYVMKLESIGCQCSKGWRRDYIKYYIAFILIVIVTRTFDAWTPESVPPVFMTIQFMLTVVFVIVVYYYISDLKEKKCACSVSVERDVLEIFNMLQMFLLAISLVLIVHIMFTIAQASIKLDKARKLSSTTLGSLKEEFDAKKLKVKSNRR